MLADSWLFVPCATVPAMLTQRLVDFVDDLAGVRVFDYLCVAIVPSVLRLFPVHVLLTSVRPARLGHHPQPWLAAGLPSFSAPSFPSDTRLNRKLGGLYLADVTTRKPAIRTRGTFIGRSI